LIKHVQHDAEPPIFFLCNPFLFASCTCTFSKWCNTEKSVKRSAQ
jgi:hypothetical protein